MLKSKPSGILKKAKVEEETSPQPESEKLDRQKYEEIVFIFDREKPSPVRAFLYRYFLQQMLLFQISL